MLFPGADLEMAFGDTEIDACVSVHGKERPGFHPVAGMQDEFESLLVDSRGSDAIPRDITQWTISPSLSLRSSPRFVSILI